MKKQRIKVPIRSEPYFLETDCPVFKYEGVDFAITANVKEQDLHDFTHVYSGMGFNGEIGQKINSKNFLEAFEFRLDAIGRKKFWEVVNQQLSVDENVLKFMQNRISKDVENANRLKVYGELRELLKMHIPIEDSLLIYGKHLTINIFKFEEKLKQNGYKDDGESMKAFMTRTYGEHSVILIKQLF